MKPPNSDVRKDNMHKPEYALTSVHSMLARWVPISFPHQGRPGKSHSQTLPIKAHMLLSASQEDVGVILLGVVSVAFVPATVGQVDDGGAIPVAYLWRSSHVTQILQSNWTEW